MTIRRLTVCLTVLLALTLSGLVHAADNKKEEAAAPECLKGIVAKVTDEALLLKNTSFPDETIPKRDMSILVDKETTYFDGTKKVNRAALAPGHIVLVYCKMAGKERKAALVRIIGGKKP